MTKDKEFYMDYRHFKESHHLTTMFFAPTEKGTKVGRTEVNVVVRKDKKAVISIRTEKPSEIEVKSAPDNKFHYLIIYEQDK